MEGRPVVEVVEIDRAGVDRTVVGEAAGGEDVLASGVVVDVALNGDVVFVDGGLVKLHARLRFDPRFELGVAGLLALDELAHGGFAQAKGGEDHAVVTFADARIVGVQLAAGFEGGFLPKAGQVDDAERSRDGGTDHWDVVAHVDVCLLVCFVVVPPQHSHHGVYRSDGYGGCARARQSKIRIIRIHGYSVYPRNRITLRKAYLFDLQFLKKQPT